ncbi:MAG: phosphatidylglycerol lysyltransferase domain-containing protein [Gaiellaceae bacterium]
MRSVLIENHPGTSANGAGFLAELDRFGSEPLSFLLRYDAPWRTFSLGEGVVCYLESPHAAVVWTDPLCTEAELPVLLGAFGQAMRAEHRAVCLLAVSEQAARAAIEIGFSALKIGEEPWFDFSSWQTPRGNRGKKYRWAANHARRMGVEIEDYRPGETRDAKFERDVLDVLARWRAALKRPETDSFLRASPFEQAALKRVFLARRAGRAEAALACAYLPAINGWYLEDSFRAPDAVNGATELLISTALTRLQADGAAGAAFALAPMRGFEDQLDRRARLIGHMVAGAIERLDNRYGFGAIARYEARFDPSEWRPRYLAFLPALPRPAAIRAALRVLSA